MAGNILDKAGVWTKGPYRTLGIWSSTGLRIWIANMFKVSSFRCLMFVSVCICSTHHVTLKGRGSFRFVKRNKRERGQEKEWESYLLSPDLGLSRKAGGLSKRKGGGE